MLLGTIENGPHTSSAFLVSFRCCRALYIIHSYSVLYYTVHILYTTPPFILDHTPTHKSVMEVLCLAHTHFGTLQELGTEPPVLRLEDDFPSTGLACLVLEYSKIINNLTATRGGKKCDCKAFQLLFRLCCSVKVHYEFFQDQQL